MEGIGAARLTSFPLSEGRGVLLVQWDEPISPQQDLLIEAPRLQPLALLVCCVRLIRFRELYQATRSGRGQEIHQRLIAIIVGCRSVRAFSLAVFVPD